MSDLIERQAAINALCDNCDNVQAVCAHYPCKQYIAIEKLQSVDAVPVRHGRWKKDMELGYQCSVCEWWNEYDMPYCPSCGAKMDGERRTDD